MTSVGGMRAFVRTNNSNSNSNDNDNDNSNSNSNSNSNDNSNSRFPSGMTERKAKQRQERFVLGSL
jgi:hypothetical protein